MNKDELREKRNRTIETLDDIKAVLGLDELYIDELEKENTELKRDKEDLIFIRNQNAKCMCEDKEQLTKAKELLAKWVELFKPKGGNIPPTPIQVETEQFLKE